MTAGVVTLLVTYVLPKFALFFKGFHTQLPLPTRMLINSANFLAVWWWVIVSVSVADRSAAVTVAWRQPAATGDTSTGCCCVPR